MQKCTIQQEGREENEPMQISRHWRLNAQRYRLEGYRHADGRLSLQVRPAITTRNEQIEAQNNREKIAAPVA